MEGNTLGDVEVLLRTQAWCADVAWPFLDARGRAHVCRQRRMDNVFSLTSCVIVAALPPVVIA